MSVGPQPGARFLALAPMDGITDAVYRDLLTGELGVSCGIDLCVSEFVRVTGASVPRHVLLRDVPELARNGRTRAGVPVLHVAGRGSARRPSRSPPSPLR
ncbi:MAG: hypothetical protein IAG13_00860 [Deltaproteobacteria bacterium]|nr:hypothetical protein [Nannocystaceae bacterium]